MRVLNSSAGYGWVTKFLHWLTVLALVVQFVLGYSMEALSESVAADGGGSGHGGGGGGDGEDRLVFVHAWLGGAILTIAVVRLLWRRATSLPPWSERLGAGDRVVQTWTERILLLLLFVIPSTGLALLFLSGEERELGGDREWQPPYDLVDDDVLLAVHVTSHIAFYLTLAVHVGLVLRRRTLPRML